MSFRKEFLKELREKRTSYKDMIDFCCDSLILNNDIISELSKNGYYFDIFCGSDREFLNANGDYISEKKYCKLEEEGEEVEEVYTDFYQDYIISHRDAERLAEFTNETVFYNDDLNLYLLAVSHYGTSWDYVPSNWKEVEEVGD